MPEPRPPETINPDHDAARWFADTQLEFVHSHIANLARCYLEVRAAAERTLKENGHLADGDNCTLIHLKRAFGRVLERERIFDMAQEQFRPADTGAMPAGEVLDTARAFSATTNR